MDERAPSAKQRSEQRKRDAALRYDLEMESRMVGWGDPVLVYDKEKDLFRFRDGRFAFSRDHADWALLRKKREEEAEEGTMRIPRPTGSRSSGALAFSCTLGGRR